MGTPEAARTSAAEPGGTNLAFGVAHDWMTEALCTRRTDVEFFPDHGRRATPAKVVCQTCPVNLQCLDYSIVNEILDGVWGGLAPQERAPIIRRRRGHSTTPEEATRR